MAPRPGIKASPPGQPEPLGSALARTLSFLLLAGLGLAVLAGAVLLPAYARLNRIIVERDRLAAANADDQDRIAAQERLIEAIPDDRILAKRLAMKHFGSLPRDEHVVAADDDLRAPPAGSVAIEPHPRPEPPDDWLTATATKITHSPTRLALVGVAVAALVASVFFTSAPRRRRKATPSNTR